MTFLMVLTDTGAAKVAAAQAGGDPVALTQFAVGDGNGAPVAAPLPTVTELVNERWRGALSALAISDTDPAVIVVEGIIPADQGGWSVHELGIFDEAGDLFAYGNFPATYKPVAAEGSSREMVLQASIRVASAAAVTIVVDPDLVGATRAWVLSTFLQKALNLADVADAAEARENLGLGAAVLGAFMVKTANLSDVADPRTARANIGLSDAELYFAGAGF